MARLFDARLWLEIKYRELDPNEWVQYDIRFGFGEENLFNTALLKRNPPHWADRREEAFRANDFQTDSLVPTLERVVSGNRPQSWGPLEPDITVAFYPKMAFPFIYTARTPWGGAEVGEENPAPEDSINVIAMVDRYNLQGGFMYHGCGPALILMVSRQQLTDFLVELREEYAAMPRREKGD